MFEWQVYNNINFERKCQEKQQHTSTLLNIFHDYNVSDFKVHVNCIQRRCEKMRIIKIDAGKTCQPFLILYNIENVFWHMNKSK